MNGNADRARSFLEAWAAGDAERMRATLAEDVTFESPLVTLTGRDAVASAMLEFSHAVTGVSVLAVAEDDAGALVMYDMHTGPFGTVRAAERYEFRDGLMTSDRLVFDTAPLRAADDG